MPKDSHLLPTHTQELLRAARSGRLYKRPPPTEEEEGDADAVLTEKADKKEDDPSTKGFQVKVWKQIPRNAEGPTVSHLAKRRKGTVTLSSDLPAGAPPGPTVTKATVRRIDAAGNPYTQEITLNEGQPIDGEIISTTVVPAPNPSANGDAAAAATPVRRRPPPPKRKPKGPGRGRKKRLPLPPSTRPGPSAPGAVGAPDSTKPEGADVNTHQPASHNDTKNQDTEMADDDDGDDGEDDGDDGDDGDEGDEEDDQDVVTTQDITVTGTAVAQGLPLPQGASPPPTLDLSSAVPALHLPANHLEGSPLKNVVPAESPADQPSELPPQSETTVIPEAAASETEPPPVSAETAPEPAQSIDSAFISSAPVESIAPTSIPEVKHGVDTEMTDAIPGGATETVTETTTEATTETESAVTINRPETMVIEETPQEIERPTIDPPEDSHHLPSIETAPVEEVIEAPNSTTETPSSNQTPIVPVMESVTHTAGDGIAKEEPTMEANAPESLPESADPAPGITTANDEAVSGPEVIGVQVEPVVPQAADEPESPDLFSGLEAALNQQGPKEEPAPSGDHEAISQETKTPAPPEASVPETAQ
ncbi:hypothetical protein F4775DRAFT_142360 [Biscogniauxia sp. FL1348]|nr:hypothetical protein F4775DRAFT_142360 [Biscogniauxia sp. FL1348]